MPLHNELIVVRRVQLTRYRRGRKLVACLYDENRVVIYDVETGDRNEIEVKEPWKCSSSQRYIAVSTSQHDLHLFSHEGVLVHIVPDSTDAKCVAFHPRYTNILAIGYGSGTVRIWDVSLRAYLSVLKAHTRQITSIRVTPDDRLFLSSWDKTASAITLDDQFECVLGHT